MADHRFSQPARLFGGGFGDVGRETFEKFKTVHAFIDMFLDRFARFVLRANDNAATLPALLRHALRPRPIERMAGNPQARPANLALLNAFFLRDDPFGRTIIDVGASGHTVGEMKLADPLPIVAVPVDQPRQHRLALGIDDLRAARNSDLASLADLLNASVLKNHDGVVNRGPSGSVDQRAADDGHRPSLRPKRGTENQTDEPDQKKRSRTNSELEHSTTSHQKIRQTAESRLRPITPLLQHSNLPTAYLTYERRLRQLILVVFRNRIT